jgi:hypothetical protein
MQSLRRNALVGLSRVELLTSRLSGVRSNHLSYRPKNIVNCGFTIENITSVHSPSAIPQSVLSRSCLLRLTAERRLLRKEVIQPHLPIRLPCYDLAPVTGLTLDACFPYGLAQRFWVLPASMA